jgi:hypothetical protein
MITDKRTNPEHHSALENRGASDKIYVGEELIDVLTFGHHA